MRSWELKGSVSEKHKIVRLLLNYGIFFDRNKILQTNIITTVWQTVRRITNEILGVKGFIAVDLGGLFSNIFQSLSDISSTQ